MAKLDNSDLVVFEDPGEPEAVQELEVIEGEVLDVGTSLSVYRELTKFVRQVLTADIDYGTIPGVAKRSLLKPGAEKFRRFFNLSTETVCTSRVEQWDVPVGENTFPLFSYTYLTTVTDKYGKVIATCEGSCNSYETKYRFRKSSDPGKYDPEKLQTEGGTEWIFEFTLEKKETTGQYGKPPEVWESWEKDIQNGVATKTQKKTRKNTLLDAWERDGTLYRLPNDTIYDQINTMQKMGQKRSFVGAILLATGASEFFTQDVEDYAQHLGQEETSVRSFVPDKATASRKLIAYVKGRLPDDNSGEYIKAVLEQNGVVFSLDKWGEIIDLLDETF